MTTWLLLAVVVALVAAGITAGWVARRQRASASRRRAETLADVARRVDAAVGSLDAPAASPPGQRSEPAPAPLIEGGTRGRAGLVDAAVEQVAAARAADARLAAAIVRTAPGIPVSAVAEIVERHVYVVGPEALAFLLPGFGRADALGLVARLDAHLAVSGRAVELEPGESATELVARLLA
jgi:hypothetical protein